MADEWDWLKKVPGAPGSRGIPDVIPSISSGVPDDGAEARRAPVPVVGDDTNSSLKQGDLVASRWRIEEKVGEGAYGEVYRAFNTDYAETVALKTFHDRLLGDPRRREAFKREALTWVSLDWHPFILAATWAAVYSGRLFVETDYIAPDEDGRVTLADWLRLAPGPIQVIRALEWAIQFCLGMEHANAHGMSCHRDIKPTNILIDREGRVRIGDFGLALDIEQSWSGKAPQAAPSGGERPGRSVFAAGGPQVCGSPGYMAPEVLDGVEADVLSDIYSFGVVLWQMATGTPLSPFAPAFS
ncbi:MAG: serine/threonine protein kinase, partial [Candidatus Riflebacteria bacterium]|nr:serine/threonine protein kinase [Candidatus Riflebacteria bacterium]